jgi:hypothetical protein
MKGFFYQIRLFREKSYHMMILRFVAEVLPIIIFIYSRYADTILA